MINKKKIIGLLIMSKDKDDWYAILQIRGKHDHEENKPEIWAGICQLSVSGGCHEGENYMDAIIREATEEIQSQEVIKFINANKEKIFLLNEEETTEKIKKNYALVVPHEIAQKIKWLPSAEGSQKVTKEDLKEIITAEKTMREVGVDPSKNIVMFEDQIIALKKAFLLLAKEENEI